MSYLAVEGHQVTFSYERKKSSPILKGLNIQVQNAIIYGLLGPSGCGKTTLLRCIIGRLQLQSGEINIHGRKPGEKGFCIPGHGVGYMPQDFALYCAMTIEETFWYFGHLFDMGKSQIVERITFLIKLLKLPDRCTEIKKLSGGQKRRISFAAALIHNPPLLVLDEPTVGVDPILRRSIWNHLRGLANNDRTTIIITTHYVEEARRANVVGLMRNGRLLTESNPDTLIQHHEMCSLEEVFLKLCKDDDENVKSQTEMSTQALSETSNRSISCHYQTLFFVLQGKLRYGSSECRNISSIDSYPEKYRKKLKNINALMKKNFTQFRRNVPLVMFQLLLPVLQVVCFHLFIGKDPSNLPIAIVNMDSEGGHGQKFTESLDNLKINQIPYSNLPLAMDSVRLKQTLGAIYIGPDFTLGLLERFLEGNRVRNETVLKSSIKLYLDMTNQQMNFVIPRSITKSYQDFAKNMLIENNQNPLLAESPIKLTDPIYGKEDATFNEFTTPGVMLCGTHFLAIMLTAISIMMEKKEGLLDRSIVAGVSCAEIIFSILLNSFLVVLLQVIAMLAVILLVLQFPIHGSVIWVFVCTLAAGTSGIAVGVFISSVCEKEDTALMITMSAFISNFLFSGIMWPTEAESYYFRYFSYCFPLTLLVETVRSIMSRGWGMNDHNMWNGLFVSIGWIVIPISLAAFIFKHKI